MYLLTSTFRPYVDLDGEAAAKFLQEHGYKNVVHRDMGTHGCARGEDENGYFVTLSTNGYFDRKPSIEYLIKFATALRRTPRNSI